MIDFFVSVIFPFLDLECSMLEDLTMVLMVQKFLEYLGLDSGKDLFGLLKLRSLVGHTSFCAALEWQHGGRFDGNS